MIGGGKMRTQLGLFATVLLLFGSWWALNNTTDEQTQTDTVAGAPLVAITLPARFSELEQMGIAAFEAKCADCHGANGVGKDGAGPPLVHKVYEPSHHGDMAFQLVVQNGVTSHHWPFGNMPSVEGLTRADVGAIIAYVRALQRENGIN
jgi:mono/diheme cytochrome c family protein